MFRFITFLLLVCFIFAIPVQMQVADKKLEKARQSAAKIAAEGDHIGEVKFRSGEKRKGRISAVSIDSFTISDLKGTNSQSVSFSEVDSIKKSGRGLSPGAIIGIVAAGAAAAVVLSFVLIRCRNELGCGAR